MVVRTIEATPGKYPELIGEGPIRGYDVTQMDHCEFCARWLNADDRVWVWYMGNLDWYLVPVHKACHKPKNEDPNIYHICKMTYVDPGDDDLVFDRTYENQRYEP